MFWVFTAYIILQVNAILHHGSHGQDFLPRYQDMLKAGNPLQFVYNTFKYAYPDPPLYGAIRVWFYQLTGGVHTLEVLALFQLVASMAGFYLLYRILPKLIASPILRIAFLIFFLFLPVFIITTIVLADDCLTTPIFIGVVAAFIKLAKTTHAKRYTQWCLLVMLLLALGLTIKYTFISMLPAFACIIAAMTLTSRINKKQALLSAFLLVALPGILAYAQLSQVIGRAGFDFAKEPINPFTSPYMTVRNLIFPNSNDWHLLNAPAFDERSNPENVPPQQKGKVGENYNLQLANRFSYPGLAHLGIYTDLMNIYQYDPNDFYIGIRSDKNQRLMSLAVKTGLLFSLLFAVTVPVMSLKSAFRVFIRRDPNYLVLFAIAILSWGWFLNITAFFPFITTVYPFGFWTPRLIVPALMGFMLLSFIYLDRIHSPRRELFYSLILAAVVGQSVLHCLFLWPWGNY